MTNDEKPKKQRPVKALELGRRQNRRQLGEPGELHMPAIGSLFSGIGGIDIAFQQAGFEIAFQVEIDPFCQAVLKKHFPHAQKFEDIRNVRSADLPSIDALVGGFPCQDISIAKRGERSGLDGKRSGLWKEFARLISELRPRFVFVENVPQILNLGGTDVVTDLTKMGYDAEWGIIPAYAVGSPQKRERWFLVGYANSIRQYVPSDTEDVPSDKIGNDKTCGRKGDIVHSSFANDAMGSRTARNANGKPYSQPRMDRVFNGLSYRVDGHFPARTNEQPKDNEPQLIIKKPDPNWQRRMKALGNAVVPQIVYPIAKAIMQSLQEEKIKPLS